MKLFDRKWIRFSPPAVDKDQPLFAMTIIYFIASRFILSSFSSFNVNVEREILIVILHLDNALPCTVLDEHFR